MCNRILRSNIHHEDDDINLRVSVARRYWAHIRVQCLRLAADSLRFRVLGRNIAGGGDRGVVHSHAGRVRRQCARVC